MVRRVELKIYGRVQGVFFRESARNIALKLGLFGYVCNEPDGKVKIIIEGEEGLLYTFLGWARSGPEFAQVDKLEEEWSEATGEFNNFIIR
ncbi:acylphosphatase [Candidatus Nomurabacteria bacterium CG10_big_fil_rev_8_21_14_0_10_35_16]|uniref:acylphosphatase n=1 Tax=Candidatus Nomurabacteria bacterium CG10_big_fil_rev_8_21_14_0_10_35_16 TaxID=1974731 RepID=A0A2H0TB25_9BACT|nr:MAG: acylphosphatase [Candidatus Nomurabacteria bacterium CG10_big_fil_rev_8_21_14_0_10_35_16]